MPHLSSRFHVPALVLLAAATLLGCIEQVPGLGPDPRTIARENEAKAIGGACRHAMRGLEDCYALNPKASKNSIYLGWKDMDEYMREHKLEGTPSVLPPAQTAASSRSAQVDTDASASVYYPRRMDK